LRLRKAKRKSRQPPDGSHHREGQHDDGREHANLAIGDLASRARVLSPCAAGGGASLEKSGFVDGQIPVVLPAMPARRVTAHRGFTSAQSILTPSMRSAHC